MRGASAGWASRKRIGFTCYALLPLTIADNGAQPLPSDPAARRARLPMTAPATAVGALAFTAEPAPGRLSRPPGAMIRFAIGLLPCLVVPRYRRAMLTSRRRDLLFLRGFFGGLAVLLYFSAIEHTTVGVATLLNYTAPLYSGVLSMLFLGEEISAKVLIPMPVALAGVFLVVHAHAAPGEVLGFGKWELVGACSAVASGAAVTAMRAARRGENSWSVYGSFCLLGLFVTMPQGLRAWKTPTTSEWGALAAEPPVALGEQLTMTVPA